MHTEPFGVTVDDRTLHVHGDVDMSVSEQLFEGIQSCAEDPEHDTVVVDLGGVTFMDSAGISSLVRSHRALEAKGRRLVIANLPDQVRLTFSMVGVMGYLNIDSAFA